MSVNPAQVAHYKNKLQYEIDAWDLQELLNQKANVVVVVDARATTAYQKEHIHGAINFPHRTMTKETTQEKLNPETLYVTYCDGIMCNASTKGALKLAELGYQVKELIGGLAGWKWEQYPTVIDGMLNNSCEDNMCGCG
jgi:rhodanese-related sulfurtransferase